MSEPAFFRLHGTMKDFHVDEIRKGLDAAGRESDEEPATARFVGIVSASGADFQGEDMEQDGLDWKYFKKSGWFNWEHETGPENIIGYPDSGIDAVTPCKDSEGNPATRVVGHFLLHKKKGAGAYETAMALQKSQSGRQLGFSVEGPVLKRDPRNPKHILKAWVRNIAITTNPMRDTARFELVKSLGDGVGMAGYQTPMEPDISDCLSALLTQSIDKQLADATAYAGRHELPALKELVKKEFPHLSITERHVTATHLKKYLMCLECPD